MRFNTGLRALGLGALVAIGTLTVIPATATATEPVAPTDVVEPETGPIAPIVEPDPVIDPDPSPTPTPDPVVDPSPTPDPIVDPTPTPTPVTTPTRPVVRPAPARPRSTVSRRSRISRIALNQRGDPYRSGATGPGAFDCSGLVRYAYRKAGAGSRLGGGHSARAMYAWGRRNHLTSRRHARVGDVVVYGRGSHVGIWLGNGRVISALNGRKGIRITRLHALTSGFTTFIHTRVR